MFVVPKALGCIDASHLTFPMDIAEHGCKGKYPSEGGESNSDGGGHGRVRFVEKMNGDTNVDWVSGIAEPVCSMFYSNAGIRIRGSFRACC